jgi:leucyl aminopeptidase (aminopeptidase T)
MNLQSGESCVVVTDDELEDIGHIIYEAGSAVTDDCVFVKTPPGPQHGAEPPAPVFGAMKHADVVVAPTTKSISHTRTRQNASDAGARERPGRAD